MIIIIIIIIIIVVIIIVIIIIIIVIIIIIIIIITRKGEQRGHIIYQNPHVHDHTYTTTHPLHTTTHSAPRKNNRSTSMTD